MHESLARADKAEADICKLVDNYIEKNRLDAPMEALPMLRDGYAVEARPQLDLRAAGIRAVIWAIGYTFDFALVKAPVFDASGFPLQTRGVTAQAGLYFVGLPWLHTQKSGLLLGVGDDAAHISKVIVARRGGPA